MEQATEKIFNEKINQDVVHETLRWLLASQRQGNHSAKTRSEVSGGGIKPWKQKGTGRARAGSIRSPLWRKGGVIFPPKPREYVYSLPKKVRKLAIRVALSEAYRENKVKFAEILSLPKAKTKEGVKFLSALGVTGHVLFVLAQESAEFERGVRNIPKTKVVLSKDLNIFDILRADWLVFEKGTIAQLEERLN